MQEKKMILYNLINDFMACQKLSKHYQLESYLHLLMQHINKKTFCKFGSMFMSL